MAKIPSRRTAVPNSLQVPHLSTPRACLPLAGIEKGDEADDDIGGDQEGALEIVAATVEHQKVGYKGRYK